MTTETAVLSTAAAQLTERIANRTARVGIIGLGYVGLPLAIEFAKAGFSVTGIDVIESKVARINAGDSYVQDVLAGGCRQPRRRRQTPRHHRLQRRSPIWTRSTSASRRPCERPKTRT